MSSVGCSLGLTLGGMGRTQVGGGSADNSAGTSTKVEPSCVQKVSHSSVNSRLHLGQRLMNLWSAATCRRFGRSRLVAAISRSRLLRERGIEPLLTKAVKVTA